jgi:3-hydroxyanthranilate 3,4-dioxygenase
VHRHDLSWRNETVRTLKPINLDRWIEEHRAFLRPPVCNKRIFPEGDMTVMIVGGPNARRDYHDDPGEELFYQIEGDMLLKTMQDGEPVDIPIRAGEMFLLSRTRLSASQAPSGSSSSVRAPRASSTDSCGSANAATTSCTPSTSSSRTSRRSSPPCSSASSPTNACAPAGAAAPSCRAPDRAC